MTLEIAIVLAILVVSLILFISEKIRMDVVALLVLVTLAFTGLVTPTEALAGFSNPAVITVWAMFILSAGLTETGVAAVIGRQVLKLAGTQETRMIIVIMLTSGVLSAFMNNIGVAAFMLPVVVSIARKTKVAPSRLLMPLAFGSLLGGLTTLIGTPPNLLISNGLKEAGYAPFGLFDFSPIGGTVMLAGVIFLAFGARFLLPERDPGANESETIDRQSLQSQYQLMERSFYLRLNERSPLSGRTLADANLSQALGFQVIALQRNGGTLFSPKPNTMLKDGDRLFTQGNSDRLNELIGWRDLKPAESQGNQLTLAPGLSLIEAQVSDSADFAGKTLVELNFRQQFGLNVLVIHQDGEARHQNLARQLLKKGDRLLLQGSKEAVDAIKTNPFFEDCRSPSQSIIDRYQSAQRKLFEVEIPDGSWLEGKALTDSRLGQTFDIQVIAIERKGEEILLPDPHMPLQVGDRLMLHSRHDKLDTVRGLQQLSIETMDEADRAILDAEDIELVEATLAPNSSIAGKTAADLDLRNRYGLLLLGILRAGKSIRYGLGDKTIEYGDALLLMGPREKAELLQDDKDFLLLSQLPKLVKLPRKKSILASAIMAMVIIPVFVGWMPIALTAIAGATLMVSTKCLRMEEAYRSIEWKAVFLIAGMLPLGTAMQETGAATYLTQGLLSMVGNQGPWVVVASLYIITSLATTIIPTAALVVLMSPIAIQSSESLAISPYSTMMAIALAASASFTSPISHPANILVMGPGGYRFNDYLKVGIPLAFVVFLTAMSVLPFMWPFD